MSRTARASLTAYDSFGQLLYALMPMTTAQLSRRPRRLRQRRYGRRRRAGTATRDRGGGLAPLRDEVFAVPAQERVAALAQLLEDHGQRLRRPLVDVVKQDDAVLLPLDLRDHAA